MVYVSHSLDHSMHGNRAVSALFAMFVLGACSSPTPAAAQPSPTASPSPLPTASATPTDWPKGGPVPSELTGVWYVGSAPITFFGSNFTLGESGGNVVVNGAEIDFFNGVTCAMPLPGGIGRYTWTLTGGSVHLVSLAPDPCPGRRDVLGDATFRRTRF